MNKEDIIYHISHFPNSSAIFVNCGEALESEIREKLFDITTIVDMNRITLHNKARITFAHNILTLEDAHLYAGYEYDTMAIYTRDMSEDAIEFMKAGLRSTIYLPRIIYQEDK